MEVTEFNTKKHKCLVCDKYITPSNVVEHAPCLKAAYNYDGGMSFDSLLGLFLQQDWIIGPYGQDAQHTFMMTLKDIDTPVITQDPVLKMTQFALAVAQKPKSHKYKGEVEPPPDPEPVG